MISLLGRASPLSSSNDLPMVSGIMNVVRRPKKLIAARMPRAPCTPRPLGKQPERRRVLQMQSLGTTLASLTEVPVGQLLRRLHPALVLVAVGT